MSYSTHFSRLESETIHIMREVAAEAENPVMLYSVGKDSAVMLHLAKKAFHPSSLPIGQSEMDGRMNGWMKEWMDAGMDR